MISRQLTVAKTEIERLRAAIATPEVYAGIITRVVEDERDAAVGRNIAQAAEIKSLQAACETMKGFLKDTGVRHLPGQPASPFLDELTRAITGLMDAHQKYDAGRESARGDYSWDWGGRYADAVKEAHECLAVTLNEYIDARVKLVLDSRTA